jgi:hypothetical protein
MVSLSLEVLDVGLHDCMRHLRRLLAVDPQADLLLVQEGLEVQPQNVDLPGGVEVDVQLLLHVLDQVVDGLIEEN